MLAATRPGNAKPRVYRQRSRAYPDRSGVNSRLAGEADLLSTSAPLAPSAVYCYPPVVPSSPGAGGSRHVGRIVDPSVRDDGDPEPDLQLASEVTADPARTAEPVLRRAGVDPQLAPEPLTRPRTPSKGEAFEAPVHGDLDEIGRPNPRDERDDYGGELDRVAAPERAAARIAAGGPPPLSPTLLALFGTLIGIATVLSLVALVINIDRHQLCPSASGGVSARSSNSAAVPSPAVPQVAKRPRQKVPGPWRVADSRGDPKLRLVEGKVGTDPFIKAMTGAGVPEKEAYRVLTAMKGIRDFDKCAKSDRFSALIERGTSRLKGFEYAIGPEEIYQAREGEDGLLKGAKLDLKIERNQVTGALVYDGRDFDASAQQAGFDAGLGHVVALALQGHSSLDELERGDRVRLIAQEVTVLGEFARYTGIEAIEVQHSSAKREPLRVYYFDDPSLRGYYDATGKSPYEGGWQNPIPGAAITSAFNPRRMHPILHKIMPHMGTDIGAPLGTPVGASSPGTVSYIGPGGAAGNLIKVMHPNGVETGYAHLSRYASGVKVGDKVRRLQTIGYVGSTGRSTGPHLHFSAQRDGKFFDAESLNLDGMRVLNPDQRQRFSDVVAKYNPLLDAIPLPPPLLGATVEAPPAEATSAAAASVPEDPAVSDGAEVEPPVKPARAAVSAAPSTPGANSVYLSDKELLKIQSATDEGEVGE